MLKGVGKSPLSVARVGLLGVGPEREDDKKLGEKKTVTKNKWDSGNVIGFDALPT